MVEHLEIFGKKYPVRIGYYVMKKVKEKTGKSFSEALKDVEESGDIELHETILFAALKMGAYAETKSMEIDIEEEAIPMILDACFTEYLKLFSSETFFPKELQEMEQKMSNGAKTGKDKSPKTKRTKAKT